MTKEKGEPQKCDNVSDRAPVNRGSKGGRFTVDGELMGFIFTIVAFSVIFGVKCNQGYPNDNKPTPHDVQRVREQLRNALKDPAMTEAVIEQLKDKKATQELLTDPEIRNNLQKLADEVFPQGSLDQWMKELREKKELLEDTKPGDWARKAIQGKGDSGSIPKQKN